MSLNSKTPLALYKANLELVLRIGALLHENRQRWMQAGAAGTGEAIQRTLAETQRMLTTNDWSALSKMPGEEFWKSLRGDSGMLQANAESAMHSQTEFAEGLRQAFAEWQQQSVAALGADASSAAWAMPDPMQAFRAAGSSDAGVKKEQAREPRKPPAKKASKTKAKASPAKSASAKAKAPANKKTSASRKRKSARK